MAGLEVLTAMIYHERQQEGSMLCAQHALNSLLQGNYFTAPDLATIARSFDALEQDALEGEERAGSQNMDDTGFFSVQVMDKALDVWGLSLVRWRSEEMRPYQDSPHKILAFVLNLHQHWFTLRRFGPARTDIESDPGYGHWFNLNSSYVAPKWVSRTYLGMFLEQSEQEGYSVFAVVQTDSTKPLALPLTEADALAATLEAPDSLPGHSSSSSSMPGTLSGPQGTGREEIVIPDEQDYDINTEDVELQAALAASLAGADESFGQHAYVPRAPIPAPSLRSAPAPPTTLLRDEDELDYMDVEEFRNPGGASTGGNSGDVSDPVAASMARNQQMLEQMRRMQEAALRETYEGEVASGQAGERRRTREEEEQEELERAIAASVAEHNARQAAQQAQGPAREGQREVITINDDEEDDEDWRTAAFDTPSRSRTSHTPIHGQEQGQPNANSNTINTAGVTTASGEVHRVYDDEDEQLQEALRASLQTMPEGFVHPPSPPLQPIKPVSQPPPPDLQESAGASAGPSVPPERREKETEAESQEEEERTTSPPPPPAQVDVEEMRRRRLARFAAAGGGPATAGGSGGEDQA